MSSKYIETVCTAGVWEDGSPVRLYPIPYRYLDQQFHKYQWITAEVAKNSADPRPESYKVDCESIECGEIVPTSKDEWGKRADIVFRKRDWQFETVDALLEAQSNVGTSLGVVTPNRITGITITNRGEEEVKSFKEKCRNCVAR